MKTLSAFLFPISPPGGGTGEFKAYSKMGPRKRALKLLQAALGGAPHDASGDRCSEEVVRCGVQRDSIGDGRRVRPRRNYGLLV
jgi:hypothetical protein